MPFLGETVQVRKKYRSNLPAPEDTTQGTDRLMTPGFLCYVGELLFGTKWQTPLAGILSEIRGKELSPATVHRWTTSSRTIPNWVESALYTALVRTHEDLDRRAETVQEIVDRLDQILYAGRGERTSTRTST